MSRSFNNQEQLAANTYDVLQRTGASLQRSNQIAFETEQIGTEVRAIHIHSNTLNYGTKTMFCVLYESKNVAFNMPLEGHCLLRLKHKNFVPNK